MSSIVIKALKIGRHTYDITTDDRFMDNGSCMQLLTQSMEKLDWGHRPSPTPSIKAQRLINSFEKTNVEYRHGGLVAEFSIAVKE